MKSIPQRKDQAQKAFHENFIKYFKKKFLSKLSREQRKRECLTNHFMGRNTPTGTKRLQTISYPSQIDTRNPVQNINKVNPTTNKSIIHRTKYNLFQKYKAGLTFKNQLALA